MTEDNCIYDYDAFISYRHIPRDMVIAEKLHGILENYHTPKYLVAKGFPSRLKKIFRDREELPTSSDLGKDIEQALIKSRFLIVLCSPEAIQSQWVLKEVELFGRYHGYDKILTLLVAGEPQTAFPPGLIRHLNDEDGKTEKVIEPLAADIRPQARETALQLLKVEKLRLIAGILGCKYDELRQREHMRRMRRIITVSSCAIAFLAAFGAFTLWQLGEVSKARGVAIKNEQDALRVQSDLYSSMARRTMDGGDSLLGMSLAIKALPENIKSPEKPLTQDAMNAVYYTAQLHGMQQLTTLYPGDERYKQNSIEQFGGFFLNGDIYTSNGQTIWTYGKDTGRLNHAWTAPQGYKVIAVSPRGNRAIVLRYTETEGINVQLWNTEQSEKIFERTYQLGDPDYCAQAIDFPGTGFFLRAEFDNEGTYCFIADNEYYPDNSTVEVFNAGTGAAVGKVPDYGIIQSVSFERSDKLLLSFPTRVLLYDFINNKSVYDGICSMPLKEDSSIGSRVGCLYEDEKRLAYFDRDYNLITADIATGKTELSGYTKKNWHNFSNDGSMVAFWSKDSEFLVYNLNTGNIIFRMGYNDTNKFNPEGEFFFSPDGRFIVFSEMVVDLKKQYYFSVGYQSQKSLLFNEHIAINGDGKIVLIDDNSVASVYQLPNEKDYDETMVPYGSSLFFNNHLVSFDCSKRTQDCPLSLINCKSMQTVLHYDNVLRYFISVPDLIIVQDGDHTIHIFDTKSDTVVKELKMNEEIGDIQCSPDGKWIAIMGRHGNVSMIDTATNEKKWGVEVNSDEYGVINKNHEFGFFPDSKYLWILGGFGEGMGIRIYDTAGVLISFKKTYGHKPDSAFYAFLNPEGTRLAVSVDAKVTIWSVDAQKHMEEVSEVIGYYEDMDSNYIVTEYFNAAYIYEWDTGKNVSIIDGDSIYQAQFVDGGSRILLIDNKGVSLYITDTGEKLSQFCLAYDSFPSNFYGTAAMINGGTEIAIIHQFFVKNYNGVNNPSYIMTFPYLGTFDEVYAKALDRLHGRTFDIDQDLRHTN